MNPSDEPLSDQVVDYIRDQAGIELEPWQEQYVRRLYDTQPPDRTAILVPRRFEFSDRAAAVLGPMPAHVVALADVLDRFVPGSFDQPWTWDNERDHLDEQISKATGIRGGYQRELENHLARIGAVEQPILLGDDDRIWDGHHRIVAARRLGFETIPAECYCGLDNLTCIAATIAGLRGGD